MVYFALIQNPDSWQQIKDRDKKTAKFPRPMMNESRRRFIPDSIYASVAALLFHWFEPTFRWICFYQSLLRFLTVNFE